MKKEGQVETHGAYFEGRFKSFPVQSDEHLLAVLRPIKRNALSAGLVERVEQWCWSSLWARMYGDDAMKPLLAPWPVKRPLHWTNRVNVPLSAKELGQLRVSIERGRPSGDDEWVNWAASELWLEHTVRPEFRPPRPKN